MAIEVFRGDHYFLSNMYPLKEGVLTVDGFEVPCVEIAYQREKFTEFADRELIRAAKDGFEAKRIARRLEKRDRRPIREDWYDVGRLSVMRDCIDLKFDRNSDIAECLVATGEEEIIEGNNRGDTFWGISPPGSRNGNNFLGQTLMMVRARLQGIDYVPSDKYAAILPILQKN